MKENEGWEYCTMKHETCMFVVDGKCVFDFCKKDNTPTKETGASAEEDKSN